MNVAMRRAAAGEAYLDTLVDFLVKLRFEDLPSEVVERAGWVVADCIAAGAAGAQEGEIARLTARMLEGVPEGTATVLGTGRRAAPATAAFLNGTAGTFLELDEGNQYARGHPGIHVVPAALALCESKGLPGRDMLLAVVLGYEIGARIGMASKLRMTMHPHGTWGTVGAAVTVAKLMGSDADAMREIINLSTSLGLSTSRRTMLEGGTVRNSFAGFSNQMGLTAYDMIEAGFTGEADGLATVYGGVIAEDFRPEEMLRELGSRYEIARNYFKRHACCRYNHGTLDALEEIVGRRGGRIEPDSVAAVEVETYSLAAQLSDPTPENTLAAKFSVPFAVATTIVNGGSGIGSFRLVKVGDPEIAALAGKVSVVEDPALTAQMPERRPSRVTVRFTDGTTETAATEINRGDAEDPYGPDDLTEKFHEMTDPLWGREEAAALLTRCRSLAQVPDVARLIPPLAR